MIERKKKRKIAVLGSTGSIGVSTLDVVSSFTQEFEIVALTANVNISLLERQIKRWQPCLAVVGDEERAATLRARLQGIKTKILSGREGLLEVVSHPGIELVMVAIVGATGLIPTLAAIKSGKIVTLASKEPVVMAGKLIKQAVRRYGAVVVPVDSEPNAISQCLKAGKKRAVKKLILTASGGPFYRWRKSALNNVTPEQALAHPIWKMGKKISIDSATLMNKGLEVIEAQQIFSLPVSSIEVVIHPQGIIHSLVEYRDGVVMAALAITDMRVPIQYALTYPERVDTPLPALDLAEVGKLVFKKPDFRKFPALACAYGVAEAGGTMPAVLNAANEVAVDAFLHRLITFPQIVAVSERVLEKHILVSDPDLEAVLTADGWARQEARRLITKQKI